MFHICVVSIGKSFKLKVLVDTIALESNSSLVVHIYRNVYVFCNNRLFLKTKFKEWKCSVDKVYWQLSKFL